MLKLPLDFDHSSSQAIVYRKMFRAYPICHDCVMQTSSSTLQQPVGKGDQPVPQGTDTLAVIWNTIWTSLSCTYNDLMY